MLTGWIWYESHSCRGCVGDFTQYKVVCPLMNVPKDSCNSLAVHVLDFLNVTSLSNADDAGQLLEFVFAAIHSSHAETSRAKTTYVRLGIYFCRCGGVRGSLSGFPCFPCQRSSVETESPCVLRTTFFYVRCK